MREKTKLEKNPFHYQLRPNLKIEGEKKSPKASTKVPKINFWGQHKASLKNMLWQGYEKKIKRTAGCYIDNPITCFWYNLKKRVKNALGLYHPAVRVAKNGIKFRF